MKLLLYYCISTLFQIGLDLIVFSDEQKCICMCTVFALWDVAAFITPLGVCGVAPRADPISIWVPAVVQLQAVGRCGGPPVMNRD